MMNQTHWHKWSGFEGDGVYTIFNKASTTCLESRILHDGELHNQVRGSYGVPHSARSHIIVSD